MGTTLRNCKQALHGRSCTDVPCLVIFVGYVACFWVVIMELDLGHYIGETQLFTIYIYIYIGWSNIMKFLDPRPYKLLYIPINPYPRHGGDNALCLSAWAASETHARLRLQRQLELFQALGDHDSEFRDEPFAPNRDHVLNITAT